jgi:hypothetical protein
MYFIFIVFHHEIIILFLVYEDRYSPMKLEDVFICLGSKFICISEFYFYFPQVNKLEIEQTFFIFAVKSNNF